MAKDGELAILHDDRLDRTHNATGAVEYKSGAELRTVTRLAVGLGVDAICSDIPATIQA